MKQISAAFLIFGISSVLLHIFDYPISVLSWIDDWGEATAWLIRGALIIAGAILWFLPTWKDKAQEQIEAPIQAPSDAPSDAPSEAHSE